jgi:predicted metalloprotease with PDZ domain
LFDLAPDLVELAHGPHASMGFREVPMDEPSIRYRIFIPEPTTHLVHVAMEIDGARNPVEIRFPVWIPGSYLIREFARQVQSLQATDAGGQPLRWQKTRKDTWQIDGEGCVRVEFDFYAHELSVRTSHVDTTHAFLNPANLLPYVPGRLDESSTIRIQVPKGWSVHTALAPVGDDSYVATGYDELADSPIHAGPDPSEAFDVEGKRHTIATWGRGNLDLGRLAGDVERIVRTEMALFGELPYKRYLFILLLTDSGRGGLEHRAATALMVPRFNFRPGPSYERVLQLAAHEFFHTWNVKRIRPAWEGGRIDYGAENYTRLLWAMEGITDYYSPLTLRRAGLITPERYLEVLAEQVTDLAGTPGRRVQSLEQASFDTWIKYYRPDEHSVNSSVSYYLKGALASWLLDLEIRRRTAGDRSLDDVMRLLWTRHGLTELGVPEDGYRSVVTEVAGGSWEDFFARAIAGTEELDYGPALAAVGLALEWHTDREAASAWLGLRLRTEAGRPRIASVLSGGAAWGANLSPGDELLALDGFRVDESGLDARLRDYRPGDTVTLAVFRRDELIQAPVTLAERPATRATIRKARRANVRQRALYEGWMRSPW